MTEPNNSLQYKTRKFHDALDDLLDRPIAYNPAFKRLTQSTVASILLSQCWYWSKRHKEDDGWFFKSGKEWEEETGLTRTEQETARRICRDLGLLEEKRKGMPATMHYRVNRENIYRALGIQFAETLQTGLQKNPQFAENQQSGQVANTNIVIENPSMIPDGDKVEVSRKTALLVNMHDANFGPVASPLLYDLLRNAAITYPEAWFEEAFKLSVANGVRKWKYAEAILEGWRINGFGTKPNFGKNGVKHAKPSNAQRSDQQDPTEREFTPAELDQARRIRDRKLAASVS